MIKGWLINKKILLGVQGVIYRPIFNAVQSLILECSLGQLRNYFEKKYAQHVYFPEGEGEDRFD